MARKSNHRQRERFAQKLLITLKICAAIVFVMVSVYFGVLMLADRHVGKVNDDLRAQLQSAPKTDTPPNATDAPTQAPEETANAPVITAPPVTADTVTNAPEPTVQPQFAQLYAQNNDLIGWIKIGKDIDLPVLHRDNAFYLDHDFNGAYSSAGAIFLDERNAGDLSDDHLLVYGHNMANGSMFGTLKAYRDVEYLRKYPVISLQYAWEQEARQYVLVSLFDASMNRSDPSYIKITEFDFDTDEDKQTFIDSMLRRSTYDIPMEIDPGDQLLTLVTCSYTHDDGRYLLTARALREGETVEEIIELFRQVG